MIKKLLSKSFYLISGIYNHVKYQLSKNKRDSIKILNSWQTVDYIIKNRCSISRYGDGELNMIFYFDDNDESRKSGFQKFDKTLAVRLKQILSSGDNNFNHKIGLPATMFGDGTSYLRRNAAWFWEKYTNTNLNKLLQIINSNRIFLNTNFSRFYLSHKDKSKCEVYLGQIKKLWANRDVLIIEGEQTRMGVGNDLYEGAKSIKRILCPATDAWNKYDSILAQATEYLKENYSENTLVLCALGMTATVLAYDLAKLGWQTIDLGHIDIEYEWMRMGATQKVAIPGKFTNESKEGHSVRQTSDLKYSSQIISRI